MINNFIVTVLHVKGVKLSAIFVDMFDRSNNLAWTKARCTQLVSGLMN
jgi:hypothetical protein